MARTRPGRHPAAVLGRALALAFAVAAVSAWVGGCTGDALDDPELVPVPIGGDFTLTGTDGRPFDTRALRGRMALLFFGYAACPDACPTTMARLARAYADLEKAGLAARVVTVFVSVDPERDTPEKLAAYLGYFAVPAVGLTGTPDEVAAVAKTFGASYEKVPVASAAGYLIEHSTYLYLIDPVGRVRHLFGHGDPPQRIVDLVTRLAGRDCCPPDDGATEDPSP